MNIPEGGSVGPIIASAPSEVKIRTFASDLLSIKESGGGMPQFQKVKAPQIEPPDVQGAPEMPFMVSSKPILRIILSILFLVVFFLGGYVAYKVFLKGGTGNNENEVSSNVTEGNVENNVGEGGNGPALPTVSHVSAFRKAAEQKLPFALGTAAANASDLQTYSQKLENVLSKASLTAKFVEIEARRDAAHSAGVSEVFSAAGTSVLSEDFLAEHFEPDITMFAYRESGNFWPGYILTLKPNENWLFLKSEVAKLEASPKISSFYLYPPENHGEFYDGTIGPQPVRLTDFPSGEEFLYGWVNGQLVFSTSYAGFAEALSRL